MRVGITGHSNLSAECVAGIEEAVRGVLAAADRPLVGVSCLARGADQMFARIVLDLGAGWR